MATQQMFGKHLGKVTLPLSKRFHPAISAPGQNHAHTLKDDERTFHTEVTLENGDLQSDIDKLAEI